MSYAVAAALQTAVFTAVASAGSVQVLIGSQVFDAPPPGPLPQTYVLIGEEDVRERSDVSANGAVHDLVVSVISDAAGFADAKAVATAISDVLDDADLTLARGRLVALDFMRARARRGDSPEARRIDLRFRAWVEDI